VTDLDRPLTPREHARLAELDAFIESHGHARVPLDGTDRSLGWWIATQRRACRAGEISRALLTELDTRGVDIDPHGRKRQLLVRAFTQFATREGHCHVPTGHVEVVDGAEVALHAWLTSARNRRDQIEPRFRKTLEELGVEFAPRAAANERARRALVAYAEEHGTYDVPHDHVTEIDGHRVALGAWVRSHVSPHRGAAATLGLPRARDVGDLERDRKVRNGWRRRLAALDAYIAEVGPDAFQAGSLPRDTPAAAELGKWLDRQRSRLRRRELTAYEFRSLDLRGVSWSRRAARSDTHASRPVAGVPARYLRARRATTVEVLQDAYRKWRTPWIRDELTQRHLPMTRAFCARAIAAMPSHVDHAHIESAALAGLLDAIDRFDPSRDTSFTTYALHRLRGAIIDAQRELDPRPRRVRESIKELDRVRGQTERELGRAPTRSELAARLGCTSEDVATLERERFGYAVESLDAEMPRPGGTTFTLSDTLPSLDFTTDVETGYLAREAFRLLPDLDQWGDPRWTSFLLGLARFQREHGHPHVPLTVGEVETFDGRTVRLGNAVRWRRETYQRGARNPERDTYLESQGFVFEAPKDTSITRLRATMEAARAARLTRNESLHRGAGR